MLAQYVGWGGLADAFDPNKDNWAKEYTELKGMLSEDEYAAARGSVLNAHYTSPTVIRAIYDAVEKMGFRSGNILEPSMGVGNFFGMLPDTMQDSRLYGVELDSITGRIAQKLYPQADITVAGFETTDRRDFYDLAVGNVPFGNYKVADKAYNKLGFSIHNYFFAKAIDQLRPGGVIAFVTSRYTMDSRDSTARKHMAERADVLHRFGKLVCKVCTLDGSNGQFLSSVLGAFGGQFAQHHLRVVYKIAVDGKAIFRFAELYPVRLMVDGAVTFLQEDNVADDLCSCICLERSIR